jgi:hypothetical protein
MRAAVVAAVRGPSGIREPRPFGPRSGPRRGAPGGYRLVATGSNLESTDGLIERGRNNESHSRT